MVTSSTHKAPQRPAGFSAQNERTIVIERHAETGEERIDTSEGRAAMLHIFSFCENNQTSIIPCPLIKTTSDAQMVMMDVGGDPRRSVADFVEQEFDNKLHCIPLNPIEDPEGYRQHYQKIHKEMGTYEGKPTRYVTSMSVLNVIEDDMTRQNHIKECLDLIDTPHGGYCFFKVWKSDHRFGHSVNRDAASYKEEITNICKNYGLDENDLSDVIDDTIIVRMPPKNQREEARSKFKAYSFNGPLPIEGRAQISPHPRFDPKWGYSEPPL